MMVSHGSSLRRRRHPRQGLTLLELLAVLMILAITATIAVTATSNLLDQSRYEATKQTLTNIEEAVLGPDGVRQPDGTLLFSGFVSDIGRLPLAWGDAQAVQLAELWSIDKDGNNVADLAAFGIRSPASDSEVLIAGGWRGPYLRLPIGASELRDGWGNPFVILNDAGIAAGNNEAIHRIVSLGADNAAGGTGYDADLELRLGDNLPLNLAGHVYERDEDGNRTKPVLDDVTVRLYGLNAVTGEITELAIDESSTPALSDGAQSVMFSTSATRGPLYLRAYLNDTPTKKSNIVRVQRSDVFELVLVP